MASKSNSSVPEALNKFKYEVANEIGVSLKDGYNGDISSRDAGRVGGNMVKKMIKQLNHNYLIADDSKSGLNYLNSCNCSYTCF